MSAPAKRAVLNVSAATLTEIRRLGGQLQAETGENMTDEKTILFLLGTRKQLAELEAILDHEAGDQCEQ